VATGIVEKQVISDAERERRALSKAERLLRGRGKSAPRVSLSVQGQQVELPASVVNQLRRVISRLAQGREVAVFSPQETITTQEAADLLHVSRPFLIGLLDKGKIPFHRLGTHRRIRLEDLLAFRERFDAERKAALDRLAQLSQEAGLYDD